MSCLDCGTDDMPLDTVLTDRQWEMICPENGMLCASCIVKRAGWLPGAVCVTVHIDFTEDFQATEIPGGRVFAFLKKLEGYFWNGLEWCIK